MVNIRIDFVLLISFSKISCDSFGVEKIMFLFFYILFGPPNVVWLVKMCLFQTVAIFYSLFQKFNLMIQVLLLLLMLVLLDFHFQICFWVCKS